MSLWLAGSLFFGGALTHMVVSYYLNVHQSGKFVKEVTEQMLDLYDHIGMGLF